MFNFNKIDSKENKSNNSENPEKQTSLISLENIKYIHDIAKIDFSDIFNLNKLLSDKVENKEIDEVISQDVEKLIKKLNEAIGIIESIKNVTKIDDETGTSPIKNLDFLIPDIITLKEILGDKKIEDGPCIRELIYKINSKSSIKLGSEYFIDSKTEECIENIFFEELSNVEKLQEIIDEKTVENNIKMLHFNENEKEKIEKLMGDNPELVMNMLIDKIKENGHYKTATYIEKEINRGGKINRIRLVALLSIIMSFGTANNINADPIPHFSGITGVQNSLSNLVQDTNIYFDNELEKDSTLNSIFTSLRENDFSVTSYNDIKNIFLSLGYEEMDMGQEENGYYAYFYNKETGNQVSVSGKPSCAYINTGNGQIKIEDNKPLYVGINDQSFRFYHDRENNDEGLNIYEVSRNNGEISESISKYEYRYTKEFNNDCSLYYFETSDKKTIVLYYSDFGSELDIELNNDGSIAVNGIGDILGSKDAWNAFTKFCTENNIHTLSDLIPGMPSLSSIKDKLDMNFAYYDYADSRDQIKDVINFMGGTDCLSTSYYAQFALYESIYKLNDNKDNKNDTDPTDALIQEMKANFPDLFYGSDSFDFSKTTELLMLIDQLNYGSYDIENMEALAVTELNKKDNKGITEDLFSSVLGEIDAEKNGGVCGHYGAYLGMLAEKFLGENTALAITSGTHVLTTIKDPSTNNLSMMTWGNIVNTNIDGGNIKDLYELEIAIARFMDQIDLTGFIADPNTGEIIIKVLKDSLTEKYRKLTGWDYSERLNSFENGDIASGNGWENKTLTKDKQIEQKVDNALNNVSNIRKEEIKKSNVYLKFVDANYGNTVQDAETELMHGVDKIDNTEFIIGAEGKNIQVLIDLNEKNGLIKTPFSNNLFFNIGVLTSIFSNSYSDLYTVRPLPEMTKENRLTLDMEHYFKKEYILKAIDAALTIGTVNKADISIAISESTIINEEYGNYKFEPRIRYPSLNYQNTTFAKFDKNIKINGEYELFVSTLLGFEASAMNKVTALDGFYVKEFCKMSLLLESQKNSIGLDLKYDYQKGQQELYAKIFTEFKNGLTSGIKAVEAGVELSYTTFNERIKSAGNLENNLDANIFLNIKL